MAHGVRRQCPRCLLEIVEQYFAAHLKNCDGSPAHARLKLEQERNRQAAVIQSAERDATSRIEAAEQWRAEQTREASLRQIRDEEQRRQAEAQLEETIPRSSRWLLYRLEAERTKHQAHPGRIVLFEQHHEANDNDRDREFRVWSECYADDERWTFSEGHVECGTQRLIARGYEVHVPRQSRVSARWGNTFVLKHAPVEVDGAEVRRLEIAMRTAVGWVDLQINA